MKIYSICPKGGGKHGPRDVMGTHGRYKNDSNRIPKKKKNVYAMKNTPDEINGRLQTAVEKMSEIEDTAMGNYAN